MKELFKHRLFFLVAFVVSKATVFFAPLLLSNTISKVDYGTLEYALGMGIILASLFNLGVPNAYPYFKLKRNYKTVFEGFSIHFLYLILISVLCLLILFLVVPNHIEYILSVLIAYLFANQITYSIFYKSDEKLIKAVIVETLLYIFLLTAYFYIKIVAEEQAIKVITTFLIGYAILFVIASLRKHNNFNKQSIVKHQKLIKYGKSVMVSGFLILLIANSGKIIIDYVLKDKNYVAEFSFYFRMASFVIIGHQVLSLIYFKRIYTFSTEKLDNMFTAFLSLIILGSVATYFIVPEIGKHFFKMFENYKEHKKLFLILCFQMIYWVTLANNENVIYREKLASKMNIGFIVLIATVALVTIFLKTQLNFIEIVIGLYFLLVVATFIQFFILFKYKNIKLVKASILTIIIFIISLPLILWS